MNHTRIPPRLALLLLLMAAAVLASACKAQPVTTVASAATTVAAPASTGSEDFPAVAWAQSTPCEGNPACDKLFITQGGQANRLSISPQGFQAEVLPAEKERWVVDTGSPSPDGKWIAFTSIGYESGGPIFLQNVETGQRINLIEAVNRGIPGGPESLAEDWMWSVIGWFPDSQRLLAAPADMARVDVINLQTYTHQMIPIQTEGMSGSEFVDLSPDGSGFTYLGVNDERTEQVLYAYSLASNQTSVLFSQPFEKGILKYPRFAPDGSTIAYLMQEGHPTTGLSFAIDLLNVQTKASGELVRGNLGQTAPVWSPDGQHIAFTQQETAAPLIAAGEAAAPAPTRSNVWVVHVADKQVTQITFIDGQARSPAWAGDGKLLAFVTHDGQVGVTTIAEPGKVWQAARPSPETPYLTNAFFLP